MRVARARQSRVRHTTSARVLVSRIGVPEGDDVETSKVLELAEAG
jgi:hypothetical protein